VGRGGRRRPGPAAVDLGRGPEPAPGACTDRCPESPDRSSSAGERPNLPTFTAERTAELGGPDWLRARRAEAFERFTDTALPTEAEEVWRYSPIDRLDLDAYSPGPATPTLSEVAGAFALGVAADLGGYGALVVTEQGRPGRIDTEGLPDGVAVGTLSSVPAARELLGTVLGQGDALVELNGAFAPDAIVVDVAPGVRVERPVVIVQWCGAGADRTPSAPASFPRTLVRVGEGAELSVVEVVAGATDGQRALVVPVSELIVGDGAHLSHLLLQLLGTEAWHIARQSARVGRDATLRAFAAGLGGAYDRCRTDVVVDGQGGSSELRSAYLGTGDQVHDIRTMQDHAAPRTVSDLLCRGAVAGSSRSVYSGLIRIRKGAVRSEAMQTNNNLVLDESAHADSVPNLDIEENDVRCSHASTVGPVDDDQRYYLESRGIRPDRAERLIVLGFFDDIVERSPVAPAQARLRHEFVTRLEPAVGGDQADRAAPDG
jgi:Fe-S cluster assembly protein SufD